MLQASSIRQQTGVCSRMLTYAAVCCRRMLQASSIRQQTVHTHWGCNFGENRLDCSDSI
jgi:hypothetical protein